MHTAIAKPAHGSILYIPQGSLWGLETPPSEIYQGSQKSDVLA